MFDTVQKIFKVASKIMILFAIAASIIISCYAFRPVYAELQKFNQEHHISIQEFHNGLRDFFLYWILCNVFVSGIVAALVTMLKYNKLIAKKYLKAFLVLYPITYISLIFGILLQGYYELYNGHWKAFICPAVFTYILIAVLMITIASLPNDFAQVLKRVKIMKKLANDSK